MPISWQRSACPDWCVIEHTEDDHPDDRAHRDAGREVRLALRARGFERGRLVERFPEETLILGRWQRDGESRVWYFLGTDSGTEYELSEASLRSLISELGKLLE